MFTGYEMATLALQFVVTLIAVYGVMWKMQESLKTELRSELRVAIDGIRAEQSRAATEAQKHFVATSDNFAKIGLQINTILEGDVRELRERLGRVEAGADEWTKTLRKRTHDLSNELGVVRLDLELLKAGHPAVSGRPRPTETDV